MLHVARQIKAFLRGFAIRVSTLAGHQTFALATNLPIRATRIAVSAMIQVCGHVDTDSAAILLWRGARVPCRTALPANAKLPGLT